MLAYRCRSASAFALALALVGAVVGGLLGASFGSGGAGLARTVQREPWQPDLIDLDGPALVREAFNADVGWPRVLLTFSPT